MHFMATYCLQRYILVVSQTPGSHPGLLLLHPFGVCCLFVGCQVIAFVHCSFLIGWKLLPVGCWLVAGN
jgi:hypothetical protein